MARYDEELLETARRLLVREPGQRGRLSRARIRRSVSTSYYAIFHFVLDEATRSVVGVRNDLAKRRGYFPVNSLMPESDLLSGEQGEFACTIQLKISSDIRLEPQGRPPRYRISSG